MFRVSLFNLVRSFLKNRASKDSTGNGTYHVYWTRPSLDPPDEARIRVMRPGVGLLPFSLTVEYQGDSLALRDYANAIGTMHSDKDSQGREGVAFFYIDQFLMFGEIQNVSLVITPIEDTQGV